MTEKEMKKLSRAELLELLLLQTQETERLRKKLDQLQAQLDDRRLRVLQTGNLAQAALEINGVMEAAQAAAQQYLDNIAQMEKETRAQCERMLSDARREAERIGQGEPEDSDADSTLIREIHKLIDGNQSVNR